MLQQTLVGVAADGQQRHALLDGIGDRPFLGVADIAFDDLHLALVRALAQPIAVDPDKEPDLGDRLVLEDLLAGQFVAPVLRTEHIVDAVKDVLRPVAVLDLTDGLAVAVGHADLLDRLDAEGAQALVDGLDLFLQWCHGGAS